MSLLAALAIFGGMSDSQSPITEENDGRSSVVAEIWRSIFPRPIIPRTERERRRTILEFFVLHMRPVRVRRSTLPYTHTFGLGGSSLTLIGLMVFTGVLLMLAYEPSPERAYDSIVSLQEGTLFGGLVRNIHHWSANLLVAVVLLHMLRVFFTGGFHGPRRFNWVIGLALANIANTTALILGERRFELVVVRAVGVSRRLLRGLPADPPLRITELPAQRMASQRIWSTYHSILKSIMLTIRTSSRTPSTSWTYHSGKVSLSPTVKRMASRSQEFM